MKASTLLALGATLVSSLATAAGKTHVVHEKRAAAPSGWVNLGQVDPTSDLVVRIGLTQGNLDQAHSHLMDVSHPGSANYGKFWTQDEVTKMFAPSSETVDSLRQWLNDAKIDNSSIIHTENQGWLVFVAKARDVEDLLQTTCPYITNVGATKVDTGKTVSDPEVAAYDPPFTNTSAPFTSGGGFSNIFYRADYQLEAVETYLAKYNPPYASYYGNSSLSKSSGVYNRIGRAYPDVSANGQNIIAVINGHRSHVDGTSAATPIFAAIVNRIIDARIACGKGPIGFINPALYINPSVLNDITNGSGNGCGTNGFSAAPGWDPVTGLGTPNYPKMKDYFLSLP